MRIAACWVAFQLLSAMPVGAIELSADRADFVITPGTDQRIELVLDVDAEFYGLLEVDLRGLDASLSVPSADGQEEAGIDYHAGSHSLQWLIIEPDSTRTLFLQTDDVGLTNAAIALRLESFSGLHDPRLPAARAAEAGRLAFKAKQFELASTHFEQAAGQWAILGDSLRAAVNRYLQGYSLRRLNLNQQAADVMARAEEVALAIDRTGLASQIRMSRGLSLWRLGELDAAHLAYQAARQGFDDLGDLDKSLQVQKNDCFVFHTSGDHVAARRCYEAVLSVSRPHQMNRLTASVLNGYADLLNTVGEWQSSVDAYAELIDLATKENLARSEANGRYNRALLLNRQGRYLTALAELLLALRLSEELGLSSLGFNVRHLIGFLYESLGQAGLAEIIFRHHLELLKSMDMPRHSVLALQGLAAVQRASGEIGEAKASLSRAMAIAEGAGIGLLIPELKRSLSEVLYAQDKNTSQALLLESLQLAIENRDVRSQIRAMQEMARRDHLAGRHEQAGARLAEVGPMLHENEMALEQIEWGLMSADVARALAKPERAGEIIGATLDQISSLSLSVPSARRPEFLSRQNEAFERAMSWAWESDAPESARIVNVLELDQRRRLAGVLTHRQASLEPVGLDRRELVLEELSQVVESSVLGNAAGTIDPLSIGTLLAELDAAPVGGFVPAEADIPFSLEAIQSSIPAGTAIRTHWLGERFGLAIRIDQKSISAARLPARATIRAAAARLHGLVMDRNAVSGRELRDSASELARHLAFDDDLKAEDRHLIVVADDVLNLMPLELLPMATLEGGQELLLSRVTLSHMPLLRPISTAVALDQGSQLLIFADPVNSPDDQRLADRSVRSGVSLASARSRLPGAAAEARMLLSRFQNAQVYTGFSANRNQFLSSDLGQTRVLHLATHALANEDIPALSGFWLSQLDEQGKARTGFLGLRDILDLSLQAELVVLSACETAVGQTLSGQGISGLASAFLSSGARHVVASQWEAPDRATTELMRLFYAGMLDRGLDPATALSEGKRELRGNRRWRHPYYWAAFKLWQS